MYFFSWLCKKKLNCNAWCSQLCLTNRKSANQFPRTIWSICLRFHFNFQPESWVRFVLGEDSVLMEGCQALLKLLLRKDEISFWIRFALFCSGPNVSGTKHLLSIKVINKAWFSHCFLSPPTTSVIASVAAVSYVAWWLTLQRRALVQQSCENSFSTENACVSVFRCWWV